MRGTIGDGNLAEVFRALVTGGKSGLLFLRDTDRQKAIYLSAGRITNADSNVPEEGLGYRLLDEGLLTPQALESALRRVEPGTSLRDVLASGGSIAVAELDSIQRSLAQQVVVSSFDWRAGTYEFQEGDFSFRGELDLDTTSLLLDGVRRMFDFEQIHEKMLADPRPLRSLKGTATALTLEPAEGFIYSRVDGSASASEICAISILSEEMTCRVLTGLMAAGIIGYEAPARGAEGAPVRDTQGAPRTSDTTTETRRAPETTAERTPEVPRGTPAPTSPVTPGSRPFPRETTPIPRQSPGASSPSPRADARPGGRATVESYVPEGSSSSSSSSSSSGGSTGSRPRVESFVPEGAKAPPSSGQSTTGSFERPAGSRPRVESFVPEGAKTSPASGQSTTGSFERPAGSRPKTEGGAAGGGGQTGGASAERIAEITTLYDSLDHLNFYAVLGLPRDAPGQAIETAYRRLAERFHPNKNAWATDDAIRSKLVFVYAKVKMAYDTLRDDHKRIEHDEQIRKHEKEASTDANVRMEFTKTDRQRAVEERVRESEGLYREAKKLLEAKSHHAAHEKIMKAIEIYPEEARFFDLAGRVEMLNPNIRWQKDAETHLRKATELDPWNGDYRVALGQLYKNAGMKQKAKREFVRALELDPANEVALGEVPVAERPVKKVLPTEAPVREEEDVDWS